MPEHCLTQAAHSRFGEQLTNQGIDGPGKENIARRKHMYLPAGSKDQCRDADKGASSFQLVRRWLAFLHSRLKRRVLIGWRLRDTASISLT